MKKTTDNSLRNESFAEKHNLKIEKCERCGEELQPDAVAWLELSNTDGNYYKKLPIGHISQGAFPFGRKCASNQLQETNPKAIIEDEFIELAELLNDIMGEQIYPDAPDFSMPKDVIYKTALSLKEGFDNGKFERIRGELYYSGIIDDYGGLLDAEFQKVIDGQEASKAIIGSGVEENIMEREIKDAFDAGEFYGRQDMQVTVGRLSNYEFTALDKEDYLKSKKEAVNNYQKLQDEVKFWKEAQESSDKARIDVIGTKAILQQECNTLRDSNAELLKALEAVKNYFDYMGGENHVASRDARRAVESAINKAKSIK